MFRIQPLGPQTVQWKHSETSWREIAPGVALPERFRYTEDPAPGEPRATLHMAIVDGRAVCERLELEPAAGEALTAGNVRIQFGWMLRQAPLHAAHRFTVDPSHPDALRPDGAIKNVRLLLPHDDGNTVTYATAWLLDGSEPRARAPLKDIWQDMSGEELAAAVIEIA